MKRVDSKYNFYKNIILWFPIISTLFVVLISIGIIYSSFQKYYKKEKEATEKEFYTNLKVITKQRVDTALKVLKHNYEFALKEEKEKLSDILNYMLTHKLPSNVILKISSKPLKIDSNRYIYVFKKEKHKYIYLIEAKKYIKNKIKHDIATLFDAFRWGKKGYIFVHDSKGVCYYHIDKKLIGKNRWNLKRDGVYILRKLIKAALKHPNGTYVEYIGYNPLGRPTQKISYIVYYKPLDLTIGSGIYLQDLNKKLIALNLKKEKLLNLLIKKILITISIVFILVSFFAFVVTNIVLKKFSEYENKLIKLEQEKYEKECIDALSGFLNRKCLTKEFEKNKDKKLAVIVVDVNDFKNINEVYGFEIANKFIKILASRLKNSIKKSDIIGKGKIDEFIILASYKDKKDIEALVNRIYEKLRKNIDIDSNEIFPSIRIGVAFNKVDSEDFNDLVTKAAMSAKMVKDKEIKIAYYNKEIDKSLKEYIEIKHELEKFIRKGDFSQFEIYYQPQIDKNDNLAGMEALIRWNHPQKGIISPGVFLPIAINEGFIKKIDLWTIDTVMNQIKNWLDKGFNPGVVSCNVTMQQLESKNFIEKLKDLIQKHNLDTKYFGIEVTEESIMKNSELVINTLKEVKKLGITISLDDFGTGYSNFAKLKNLNIDKLKIDKTFIDGIPNNSLDVALTKIVIQTGKILGMKLIAEGVETKEQRDFVFENGVDYIQGYFYSKPIPSKEIEEKYFKM